MKGIILVDPKRCLACKSCELQCALEHAKSDSLKEAIYEQPLPQARVQVEQAAEVAIPLQCRHCEDAPCVEICPSKATHREGPEDPVLIKDELCVGCKWCILVCPFGVIRMGREGKAVTKCDLCFERLKEKEMPACVQACPTGALQFKTMIEIGEKKTEYLIRFKKDKKII